MDNKNIYIVLSYTGTILSRVIKIFTHKRFSHSSIALDRSFNDCYSFGRVNPYNPFNGGFVQESTEYGTFKRFKKTDALIISIDVTNEQYNKVKETINEFKNGSYKYNYLGVLLFPLKIKWLQKNRFYCSEFVKYILDIAGINATLPDMVCPYDFLKIDNYHIVYEGKLHDYQ